VGVAEKEVTMESSRLQIFFSIVLTSSLT
jgi:hypothetical protein